MSFSFSSFQASGLAGWLPKKCMLHTLIVQLAGQRAGLRRKNSYGLLLRANGMVLTKCMAYCLLLGNAGERYSIRINVFLQNLLAALAGQRDGFWRNVCPTAGQSSVPAG